MAVGVHHLGFLMTATRTHGTGLARRVSDAYEHWAMEHGARWLRLGVVAANTRAEAFWRRVGYVEVRREGEYVMGHRTHVMITMIKPLGAENLSNYLDAIPRDRA